MKTTSSKIIRFILLTVLAATALAVIIPVFLSDRFTISGDSMLPALHDGQRVIVNKLLMGARIYTKYDFSDPVMESFRMPGLRKVRPGDIIIFNYPYPDTTGMIHFRINYVYAKRCIGGPEDTTAVYVFRENYYFLAGDNVLNSRDSRYIGLIPEAYLVGIVAENN